MPGGSSRGFGGSSCGVGCSAGVTVFVFLGQFFVFLRSEKLRAFFQREQFFRGRRASMRTPDNTLSVTQRPTTRQSRQAMSGEHTTRTHARDDPVHHGGAVHQNDQQTDRPSVRPTERQTDRRPMNRPTDGQTDRIMGFPVLAQLFMQEGTGRPDPVQADHWCWSRMTLLCGTKNCATAGKSF